MRDILSARGIETELLERLKRIEETLGRLVQKDTSKNQFTVAEVATILDKANFTVRQWCNEGRLRATKARSGRGRSCEWRISNQELQRLRNEGLLPLPSKSGTSISAAE